MTNKEKYGDKIIELAVNTGMFALKNGEPALCKDIKCEDCNFYKSNYSCEEGSVYDFREWLNSEYVEPPVDWSKVAVDTPILVRDSEKNVWEKKIFCKIRGQYGVRMGWRSNIMERGQKYLLENGKAGRR